jgi:23S rRNA (cytidine1920-2'-O)/16S rRNA (cytidine1409-2'-O)-methyltransferase
MTPSRRKILFIEKLRSTFPDKTEDDLYAAVLCGEAKTDGETIRDPRHLILPDASVALEQRRFVSRGGDKLDGVLDTLGVDPEDRVCLDAGASTGGFTDCLLSRGATLVHAVDVGYNQLAWKIRNDRRVIVRERTNLMDLTVEDLEPTPTLAVADLSFRSLRGAASQLLRLSGEGTVVVLAKPQFEGPRGDGFRGVVTDPADRSRTIEALVRDLKDEGVYVVDAAPSPIRGRKGNFELFLRISGNPPKDPGAGEGALAKALRGAG